MKRLTLAALLITSLSACSGGNNENPLSPVLTPQFAGTWNGTYKLTSCTQSGDMALVDLCGSTPQGTLLPAHFEFTQTASNVTGTFYLGLLDFAFEKSTVASDGSLTLAGTFSQDGVTLAATWILKVSGSSLTGTVAQTWTADGATGQIKVNGTMATGDTVKVASLQPSAAGGDAVGMRAVDRLRITR